MRKLLAYFSIFNFYFLHLTPCSAQFNTYHPFPDSNASWSIELDEVVGDSCAMFDYETSYYDYFIKKDTLINGIIHHVIYQEGGYITTNLCGNYYKNYHIYMGSIREDSLKNVYINNSQTGNRDSLLFTFNLHVGDTLPSTYNNSRDSGNYVRRIDSILIGAFYRKEFLIAGKRDTTIFCTLIEGIGSIHGLLEPLDDFYPLIWYKHYYLNCFGQNDTTLYPSLVIGGCGRFDLSAPTIKQQDQLTIYPNPASDIIYIQTTNINFPATIEITDITGRMMLEKTIENKEQSQMNLSSLSSGIYFVIVKTKTQQFASKIVKE